MLIEFTSDLAQDHLRKTIDDCERDNNLVKNKKSLELLINELLAKYLVVDNPHKNILHAIVQLKKSSMHNGHVI